MPQAIDVEVVVVDREDLSELMRPGAAMDLLGAIGGRLPKTDEKLRHTAPRNVNEETAR